MSDHSRKKPPHIFNNPVYSQIWDDIYFKDLDALIAVCGRRGHCKSGSAIRFGEDMDLDSHGECRFNAAHVFFKASDFLAAVREKHPKGSVFVWDEVGVENDSRSWYTMKNKFIKYVMETSRYRNYVILVTVPTLKSMDISTQRLLSAYIEMHGKVDDGNSARGKFEWVETNPKTGKSYFKRPRYWDEGYFNLGGSVVFPRPSSALEAEYKVKKDEYTTDLWGNIEGQLQFMAKELGIKQGMEAEKARNFEDLEAEAIEKIALVYSQDTKKVLTGLLARELHVGTTTARQLAQVLNFKLGKGVLTVG
jgi:hypothetical protein